MSLSGKECVPNIDEYGHADDSEESHDVDLDIFEEIISESDIGISIGTIAATTNQKIILADFYTVSCKRIFRCMEKSYQACDTHEHVRRYYFHSIYKVNKDVIS